VRRPARAAAYLSIGACRLLPRAHGAGDYSASRLRGGKRGFKADSPARTAKKAVRARAAKMSLVYGGRLSRRLSADVNFVEVRGRSTHPAQCQFEPTRLGHSWLPQARRVSHRSPYRGLCPLLSSPALCAFMISDGFGSCTPDSMRSAIRTPAEDADACRNGQRGPRRSHTVHS
jgi:hypothetical protein